MNKQTVGIAYGVLSDPISKQLEVQGFKFNKKKIEQFEKELDALHVLQFGCGLITDNMYGKILEKLHKKIVSHVSKQNKTTQK